jgi:hypothetical protein
MPPRVLAISGSLSLLLLLACSSKEPEKKEEAATPAEIPSDAQAAPEQASTPTSTPQAAFVPRDWKCPVIATAPRGGRFGEKVTKRRAKRHAGLTEVVLQANDAGVLHLAVLAEDDAENDLGVSINQPSPPRGVSAYRYKDETWEDLGRPAQLIGWEVTLEAAIGEQPAYAVSAGIGDVRRAVVASCESGRWRKDARFTGESYEAAALVLNPTNNAFEDLSILRGRYPEVGPGCKPTGPFGGGKVPVSIQLPESYGDPAETKVSFAGPDECRLPRKWMADARAGSVAVAYEQCQSQWGGDHVSIANCQIAALWFSEGAWKRLPSIQKLGAYEFESRHAIALGDKGPLLAVTGTQGLSLHQAEADGWTQLPPLPGGKSCLLPIDLRNDPARVVTRTCGGHGNVNAYLLEEGEWKSVGSSFSLKPKWGAEQRPAVAADWIDRVPYLALGYYGAPVARVFEGKGKGWQQILEATVDPDASPRP